MKREQIFFNQLKKVHLFFSLTLMSAFVMLSLPSQANENEIELVKLQQHAERGNNYAQLLLGSRYKEGLGVKQDYVQAVEWYRKAAEQGNIKAQYNLGIMYAQGQGVKQDLTQAKKWWKKACDIGYQNACENLKQLE
ncbi:tetratricopeptide repeat protein [Volucribacter amazonae]|uniref:Sel1 repeat-containing protein n=1 Tax=Volucribacter amazonae TaxID=256731 RepID=A0A9X4SH98_9PAST|nr:tetratricopeptide repeat protein [Volucribacter amazonae]MDG6894210.1 hypothetical protein [Volucribacter amazonae]